MGRSKVIKYVAIVKENADSQSLIYKDRLQDIIAHTAGIRNGLKKGDTIKIYHQTRPEIQFKIIIKEDIIRKPNHKITSYEESGFMNKDIEFKNMFFIPRRYYQRIN